MKSTYRSICFTFLLPLIFCTGVYAQAKRPYFQLEKNITGRDYQPGVVLLKLKPAYRDAFKSTAAREKTISRLRQSLGIREATSMAAPSTDSQTQQARQKPPVVDLSLLYMLRIDPQLSIEEAINRVYATGMVEYAEPSYVQKAHFTPNDPQLSRQYYLETIRAFEAWDITRGSEDIVIGIVDSGIDKNHADLVDKKAINEDEIPDNGVDDDNDGYIDNVWGWDFIGDDVNDIQQDNDPDEQPEEGFSHGTYVAGCAVANTNNGKGIAGVGFNTRFLVTKHSYAGDTANSIYAGYLGIRYMADQEVDIINLSFGGPGRSQFVQDIINYAVLEKNCLVVASAGNEGEEIDNYPASYDHVLSVTATNRDDIKASFANTGLQVDISAPGTGIYTTTFGSRYTSVQGTSFSAPIVSGAAALIKAQYPDMSGMQIGEILRVTADAGIYDNPENPSNRLGKGRLDVLNALTQQLPSVRIQSNTIRNTAGEVPQEGDTVVIAAEFINYLWPATSALTATLSTGSEYATVLDAEVALGALAMNDTASNAAAPFRILISRDVPENTTITLLITYSDGPYQDYEYLHVLVNPGYLNIQENLVATSISSNGRIGYQDNTLDTREQGMGFIFEETNLLFEMGLMLGTAADQLSNAVRGTDGEDPDDDFVPLEKATKIQPGRFSYSEVLGSFTDENAADNASDVTVNYRTLAWVEEPDNNYVIVRYTIRNDGQDTLRNFYAGLYADWDISGEGDKADWNEEYRTGYVYSGPEEGRLFAGIQELSGKPNYFAIDNDPALTDNPLGVYDDFTDEEKFRSLSGGVARQQAGFSSNQGTDVSHTVGSGPYTIAPGDSVQVAFALHGALSLDSLLASAQAADYQYNVVLPIPQPVAQDVVVCYGDSGVLQASGAEAYRWYTSKTGGIPADTGAVFNTAAITQPVSYFVSNAGDSVESVRTEVKVRLAVDATLQLSGSPQLCSGDSVVLSVAEADSYRWSTGDTTQSITVREAGDYFVEVHNNRLNCTATSDTLTVQTFESPEAAFQFEVPGPAVNTFEVIPFTDQSSGAVTEWRWDFGDGTVSTEQNPTHRFAGEGAYTVTLSVTGPGGCVSRAVQTLSAVTATAGEVSRELPQLFPNPAAVGEAVRLKPAPPGLTALHIYTLQGQRVKSFRAKREWQEEIVLSLEGLVPGLYLVRAVAAQQAFTYRLLVHP